MARPTDYSQAIADIICERLCDGESLKGICAANDMPHRATVFRWLSLFPEFSDMYARAREVQADALFDEVLQLADTPQMGKRMKKTGKGKSAVIEEVTGDMIEHRRLQIDARKWIAGKLRPKKYGDKLDLAVSGSLQTMPEDQMNARIAELLGKAGIDDLARREGSPGTDE